MPNPSLSVALSAAPVRVLIADDELLARRKLADLLKLDADVRLVGECANGVDTVSTLKSEPVDLLFLDVQMPELDGFATLEKIPSLKRPVVVFVTAHDKYAIQAFEIHALDYLLKPYDRDRFRLSLERAKTEIYQHRQADVQAQMSLFLNSIRTKPLYLERFVIKTPRRVVFLNTDEIEWVSAEGNYVLIHIGKEQHLLRETIRALQESLDPQKFIRIHRSTIVRLDHIKELHPTPHGDYDVLLRDGTSLVMSRSYKEKLRTVFHLPL